MRIVSDMPEGIASLCGALFGEPPKIENLHNDVRWQGSIETTFPQTIDSVRKHLEEQHHIRGEIELKQAEPNRINITLPANEAMQCHRDLSWITLPEEDLDAQLCKALSTDKSMPDIRIPESLVTSHCDSLEVFQRFLREEMEIETTIERPEDKEASLVTSIGHLNGLLSSYQHSFPNRAEVTAGSDLTKLLFPLAESPHSATGTPDALPLRHPKPRTKITAAAQPSPPSTTITSVKAPRMTIKGNKRVTSLFAHNGHTPNRP